MPAQRNAFKLGLTLILFVALFVVVMILLAPSGGGDLNLQVRFPHTTIGDTLKHGSEVILGGQPVGVVTGASLREMDNPDTGYPELYVIADISIQSDLGIKTDCEIEPGGPLLGGQGKIIISDRGQGEPIQPGTLVEGQGGADLASLQHMLADVLNGKDPDSLVRLIKNQLDPGNAQSMLVKILASLDDVNAITSSLKNEFDPQQERVLVAKLHSILDNINRATLLIRTELDQKSDAALVAKVHSTLDTLNSGISSAVSLIEDNREPLNETVQHVRETSRILEEDIASRIATQLDPKDAASMIAKVHVNIDRLGASLRDVNVITSEARQMALLNKSQINAIIDNFKQTSDHLKGASKDIRRNPWRLFYQPTMEEVAQANVFDAARAFADAATELDDAISKIKSIADANEGTIPTDNAELHAVFQSLQLTFSNFSEAEKALWNELNIK